jgi:Recombination endonuclease VII
VSLSSGSEPGKACSDCHALKPLSEFPRNRSRPDGHGIYCKLCFAVRYREHRERKAASEGRQIRELHRVELGFKYCPRCEQTLPIAAFGRNRASADGATSYCRPCHNAISKANRERRHGNTREYHLRRRYGIGQGEVDAMLAAQGGLCAACREDEPKHVDHDHKTGRVRGMLCFLCNQALGNVRDDVTRLQGLIDYLRRSRFAALGGTVEEYDLTDLGVELDSRRFHAA